MNISKISSTISNGAQNIKNKIVSHHENRMVKKSLEAMQDTFVLNTVHKLPPSGRKEALLHGSLKDMTDLFK